MEGELEGGIGRYDDALDPRCGWQNLSTSRDVRESWETGETGFLEGETRASVPFSVGALPGIRELFGL